MSSNAEKRLILASASPRRRELLASIGLEFEVISADVDESFSEGEDPLALAHRLAISKAKAVAATQDRGLVLAADTIVAGGAEGSWKIFGKPDNVAEACEMLRLLSGSTHDVVTAFAVFDCATNDVLTQAVTTKVRLRNMTEEEIRQYAETGEGLDKAGAYGIQGLAAVFVLEIAGSYTNVVGLPLAEVAQVLEARGYWSAAQLVAPVSQ